MVDGGLCAVRVGRCDYGSRLKICRGLGDLRPKCDRSQRGAGAAPSVDGCCSRRQEGCSRPGGTIQLAIEEGDQTSVKPSVPIQSVWLMVSVSPAWAVE